MAPASEGARIAVICRSRSRWPWRALKETAYSEKQGGSPSGQSSVRLRRREFTGQSGGRKGRWVGARGR